jgi:hypothetical protein
MVQHPAKFAQNLVSVGRGRIAQGVGLYVARGEVANFDFKQPVASAFELPKARNKFWFSNFHGAPSGEKFAHGWASGRQIPRIPPSRSRVKYVLVRQVSKKFKCLLRQSGKVRRENRGGFSHVVFFAERGGLSLGGILRFEEKPLPFAVWRDGRRNVQNPFPILSARFKFDRFHGKNNAFTALKVKNHKKPRKTTKNHVSCMKVFMKPSSLSLSIRNR